MGINDLLVLHELNVIVPGMALSRRQPEEWSFNLTYKRTQGKIMHSGTKCQNQNKGGLGTCWNAGCYRKGSLEFDLGCGGLLFGQKPPPCHPYTAGMYTTTARMTQCMHTTRD